MRKNYMYKISQPDKIKSTVISGCKKACIYERKKWPAHTLILFSFLLIGLFSCEKDLTQIKTQQGTAPVLKTSLDTSANHAIQITRADSANKILKILWTAPGYISDTTQGNVIGLYTIEIDTTNTFSNPKTITMGNKLDTAFIGYDLNSILLSLGCTAGSMNNVYIRVRSVFFNSDTLVSNIYQISASPYITPKIAVPTALYITGAALPGGWVTPFPESQKFTKVDATTFTLTLSLLGGQRYELITDGNGSNWTPCYRLDPSVNPDDVVYGGSFVWDGNGSPYSWGALLFKTPPEDATYTLTFDFQTATFTVTNQSTPPLIAVPSALYITGAALPGGWVTPFPESQKFTQTDATTYTLTTELVGGGKSYELITDVNGSNWTPCYRLDVSVDPLDVVYGGTFVVNGEGTDYPLGWNGVQFKTPPTSGTYTLTFYFQTATFTVESE